MKKINGWVERVSQNFEFFIVVIVAFGYFVVASLLSLFEKSDEVVFTERHLITVLVYEIIILVVLGWFLKKRGWTLTQLGFMPSWKSTLIGVGLIPAVYIIYILTWITLTQLFPEIQAISQSKDVFASSISLWQIVLVSIVNPIFEEIFVCGYFVCFLKKFSYFWIAVIVSMAIRTLYHLYQPIQGVVFIISIGLVFGFFYAKTNQLWSIVVAHAIFDLWGLLGLKSG